MCVVCSFQCCLNESSPVWLALTVNKKLKAFAANRLARPQKLVHRDVSMGRENIPIPVVNEVDDDTLPTDFQYVTENTETTDLSINRTISSLQVINLCVYFYQFFDFRKSQSI